MNTQKIEVEPPTKGKAIQFAPDTMDEYKLIAEAAALSKRSLAGYCLFHSLKAAKADLNK